MQVRLLGPVDVLVGETARPVQGARRKAVLAVLGLCAGTVVSTDRLVEVVWGADVPDTASATLQNHVSYLRGLLGDRSVIAARSPGYVLGVPPDATDVGMAERLIRQGEQAVEPVDRVASLRAAVGLWRGEPLVDVAGHPWLDRQAERLADLRLVALHALMAARLDLGEHEHLLPELGRLAEEHPFDEQFCGQLMLALYRAGRQADALARFQVMRRRLADDLGIDPGPSLRDLEAGILRHAAGLGAPPAVDRSVTVTSPVPAQLPAAVRGFAGRDRELALLDAVLAASVDGPVDRPSVVISAVSGTAGVGKTALALHWAHRVADRFPDGQLYVDLRGFHPTGTPVAADDAIREFLEALGVPAERIPNGLAARTALYRSILAGKRVLLVLDNAGDAEQVRPLLPGAPGCLVVVTSRDRLTSLVAVDGAHPVVLDLLSAAEAHELLANRLGAGRVAAEPEAVRRLVDACARLPLALAVASAQASVRSGHSLAALVDELGEGDLDGFDAGDPAGDLRHVLSWSYRGLSDEAARLFRLLGAHPGPDVAAPAVASLAGVPLPHARASLAELTRAHLLTEHVPSRYAFHDLLRAYASELAAGFEPSNQASRRMLDHYLHTSYAAATLLCPLREPVTTVPATPGVVCPRLDDDEEAQHWFGAERSVLLAVASLAARTGHDAHAWQFGWTLVPYLDRGGHWRDLLTLLESGLECADRLDDRWAQAQMHRFLGTANSRLDRLDRVRSHYRRAFALFAEINDVAGQAHARMGLARRWHALNRHDDAYRETLAALELYRVAGHRVGEARALNDIGRFHAARGNLEQALACLRQALAGQQEIGDQEGEAIVRDSLGFAYERLGRPQQAAACYRQSVELRRILGDRYGQAEALGHLGDAHLSAGEPEGAHDAWKQALEVLMDLDHPDAHRLQVKLDRLSG